MVSVRDDGSLDLTFDPEELRSESGMYHRIFIGFPWDNKNYYEIPVIPEMIAGSEGQHISTYNIVAIGEVTLLGGPKVRQLAWESHFPRQYDPGIEHVSEKAHIHPEQWKEWFRRVQREHSWMRVSILRSGIDRRFAINTFDWSYIPGPSGDLWYQIQLVEYRETLVREFDGTSFPDVDVRPPPYGALPSTYTTKAGQTLQDVSLILFGTTIQWVEIFRVNSYTLLGPLRNSREFIENEITDDRMDLWEATQPVPAGTVLTVPTGLSSELVTE